MAAVFSHARAPDAPGSGLRLLVAVTDPMSLLFLRGQLAAARAAGFDVTAVSAPGDLGARIAAAEGVRHVTVPMERGMDPLRDVTALRALVRLLRAIAPHVVDASTPKAGLLVTIAATLTGVPARIHTLRGLRFETMTGPGRAVLLGTTRSTCALAHRVLCVSPSLRRRAVALGVAPAARTMVLGMGSGVCLTRFTATPQAHARAAALRARCGIPADAPVLGFVGRLARDKGLQELAAAWQRLRAQHPRLHWLVVGPPDPTDAIPADVAAVLAADSRVHCLGHVDDVVPAYLLMDVLALPSYREGFGNVLLEAAALEIPTVASRVTGCVDAVADGVTGTLVPPRDARALASAIHAYLADPALRVRHGRAGRARAERLFRQEDLWAHQHRIYASLASRGRAAARPEPSATAAVADPATVSAAGSVAAAAADSATDSPGT